MSCYDEINEALFHIEKLKYLFAFRRKKGKRKLAHEQETTPFRHIPTFPRNYVIQLRVPDEWNGYRIRFTFLTSEIRRIIIWEPLDDARIALKLNFHFNFNLRSSQGFSLNLFRGAASFSFPGENPRTCPKFFPNIVHIPSFTVRTIESDVWHGLMLRSAEWVICLIHSKPRDTN